MTDSLRKIGLLSILLLASASFMACPDTTWLNKVTACKNDNDCTEGRRCCPTSKGNACAATCSAGDTQEPADVSPSDAATDAATPDTKGDSQSLDADGQTPPEECVKLNLASGASGLKHTYHACSTPKTYEDAVATCAALDENSNVFLPETTFERELILTNVVLKLKPDASEFSTIWLGITAEAALSVCAEDCSPDAVEPIPLTWAEGQPALTEGECISLQAGGFAWSIEGCNQSDTLYPFICESKSPEYDACHDFKVDAEFPCEHNCFQVDFFGGAYKGYRCCDVDYGWNVDECTLMNNPCAKNENVCGTDAECVETGELTYICNCPPGFVDNGETCMEATDCGEGNKDSVQHCGENGFCKTLGDGTGYTCVCDDGYMNAAGLEDGICLLAECSDAEIAACANYGACEMIDKDPTCICEEAKAVPVGECECPQGTEAISIDDAQKACVFVAPPDCSSLAPGSDSGYYLVDPSGPDQDPPPFYVWCDLDQDDGDGKGWTQIAFNDGDVLFSKNAYQDGLLFDGAGVPMEMEAPTMFVPKSHVVPCGLWQKLEEPDNTTMVVRVTMLAKSGKDFVKTGRVDYLQPKSTTLCGMLISQKNHLWWWNGFAYLDGKNYTKDPNNNPEWYEPPSVDADDKQANGYGGSKIEYPLEPLGRLYLNFWGSNGESPAQKGGCCTNTEGFDNNTVEWNLPFEMAFKVFTNDQVSKDPTE